jgi:TetR/AcrR family transcriptional repressor of mexJK operon
MAAHLDEPRRAPGRPRQDDVASLEARLLDVALKEFLQHGYGGASLNRIIAAAGVSKTTLYSRFASKEALFRAIIYQQIGRSAAALKLADNLSLENGLIAYANHALELSLKGEILAINRLIYSEAHRFPELGAAAAERSQMGVGQVAAFIRKCAARAKTPCRHPDSVAEAFILMLRGWYINQTLTNEKVSSSQRRRWVERAVHAFISDWRKW